MQLPAKLARTQRIVVLRAIGVEWHADYERVWLPFLDELADFHETGISLGSDGGLRLGATGQSVADRNTSAFESEIECKKGAQASVNSSLNRLRFYFHACPASGDSIQDWNPSNASALS